MGDLQAALLTIGTVLLFLITSESLAKLGKISKENARKLIHISVGNVIFFVPLFDTRWIAAIIPFTFVFGNYLLSPMSPIKSLQLSTFEAGHAWGTILYPLSLSITTYLFFDSPWILVAVFFPVVYGDGFAAVFGPRAKTGIFQIGSSTKSLLGTSIVSLFSWGSVCLALLILNYSLGLAILVATLVSLLAPLIEVISPKGTDNFVLPMMLSLILGTFFDQILEWSSLIDPTIYLIGVIGGLLFGLGGYTVGVLTADGAITGFLITTMMLGLGGIVIGVELFLFFILGSGATKIVKSVAGNTHSEFEKGSEKRDSLQAIAKAGFPAIFSVIYVINPNELYILLITGMMAAALVDTMSTEIGIASKSTPVKVLRPWEKAETGDTGVVSLIGTLGGLFFGLIFASIVFVVDLSIPTSVISLSYLTFSGITLFAGLAGMLTDSILGTTLQRKNQCNVCQKILEASTHHDQDTVHTQGLRWFNNDMTNILGSLSGAFWIFLIYLLL